MQNIKLTLIAPFVFKYSYQDPFGFSRQCQFAKIFPHGKNKENLIINFGLQPFAFTTHIHLDFLHNANSTLNYACFCYESNAKAKLKVQQARLFSKFNNSNFTESGINYFKYPEMPDSKAAKSDLIFAYIYGFLHYKAYQNFYKNNFIKQEIPRICKPVVGKIFKQISLIGQKLLDLHTYLERAPLCRFTTFAQGSGGLPDEHYHLTKMKFAKKDNQDDKTTIIFNEYITLTNIPAEAYEGILGNRSAVEHVMHGYKIDLEKDSDPNDFAQAQGDPQYILKLLFKVIYISCKTQKLIKNLPAYDAIQGDKQNIQ